LPANSVTVVPLGVDLDRFRRNELRSVSAVPYLFHLSSADPREHTPVVINAFALLVARVAEPVRLVVAGDLGSSRQPIIELVKRLGLEGKVDIPGRVSEERLVELYSGAVATVLASMDEGFGLQPLEAMACGSVLVSTPARATQEIAGDAEIEWTPLDSERMSLALEAVWNDTSRQVRAATINRRVVARFSWDHTAQRLHDLLEEVAFNVKPPEAIGQRIGVRRQNFRRRA
jgi:glycosyltransferase involved in cell wall biosynthesis